MFQREGGDGRKGGGRWREEGGGTITAVIVLHFMRRQIQQKLLSDSTLRSPHASRKPRHYEQLRYVLWRTALKELRFHDTFARQPNAGTVLKTKYKMVAMQSRILQYSGICFYLFSPRTRYFIYSIIVLTKHTNRARRSSHLPRPTRNPANERHDVRLPQAGGHVGYFSLLYNVVEPSLITEEDTLFLAHNNQHNPLHAQKVKESRACSKVENLPFFRGGV